MIVVTSNCAAGSKGMIVCHTTLMGFVLNSSQTVLRAVSKLRVGHKRVLLAAAGDRRHA